MEILVLHPDLEVHNKIGINLFDAQEFDQFSRNQVDAYNSYVNTYCEKYGNDPLWWACSFSSRNIFFSSFYLNWCYAYYAVEKIRNGKIQYIICENNQMKKALSCFPQLSEVQIEIAPRSIKDRLKSFYIPRILNSTIQFIKYNFKLKKAARKSSKNILNIQKPINILDIFVTNNAFDKKDFNDQYFGNFLSETTSKNWFYFPNLYLINDLELCYSNMRKNKVPFLVKEDFLKVVDYLWVIFKSFDLYFHSFSTSNSSPMDQLIREELLTRFNSDSMNSLLLYKFPKRLKHQGIKIDNILDWHEAQPQDNVINFSFKKYYSHTKLSHYVGALFSYYQGISYQAIPSQVKMKVLGDKFFFQGRDIKKSFKDLKGLSYSYAPAFRIDSSTIVEKKSSQAIAIVLPNMISQATEIIDFVSQSDIVSDKIFLSIHPRTNKKFIKKYVNEKLSSKFQIEYIVNLNEEIKNYKLIISTGTTAFVDAFKYSIGCIVIGSRSRHTLNFIPDEYLHELFEVCFEPKNLNELVNTLSAKTSSKYLDFFEKYIHPCTKENIAKFEKELIH